MLLEGIMARAGIDWRYTETRRRDFLRTLAETYDVEAALAAGRLTWPQVCELRVRHPDFAVRFEEVIAAGYDRLEAMLLRASGVGAGAKPDQALAQALIKLRRTGRAETARGGRRSFAAPASGADREKMIQSILDKMGPLKSAAAGGAWNGQKQECPEEAPVTSG